MELNVVSNCGQMPECVDHQPNKRKRRYSQCNDKGADQQHWNCILAANEAAGVESDGAPATKYREVEANAEFQLVDFPDEVLFEIFKNLDSWTQYALMNCCKRFHTLLLDHRFWKHIDLSLKPLPFGILDDVLERTDANTSCIKLRGPAQQIQSEVKLFNDILLTTFVARSTQLSVLELQDVTIDFCKVRILDFPTTLKRLVFNGCNVRKSRDEQSIFCGIHTRLTQLEELGIEYSDWFEPYYIMILSKIPALRWFSLRGCPRLGDFIPYGSMAARFGFKKLEFLDLRFTPINDSDLQCFNAVFTLKEILLDCPVVLRYPDMKCEAKYGQTFPKLATSNDDCQPSTSRASSSAMAAQPRVNGTLNNEASTSSSSATSQLNVTISLSPPAAPFGRLVACLGHALTSPSSSSSSSSSSTSSSSSSSSSPLTSSPASPPSPVPEVQAADGAGGNPPEPVGLQPEPGGNVPSRSRFLPRPDHVILLDVHNQRPRVRQVRPPQLESHFDYMLQHPLFWNIINPLTARQPEVNGPSIAAGIVTEGLIPPEVQRHCRRRYSISDRGICCFGRPQNPVEQGVIWIRIGNRPSENSFERLSVRNYKKVTDISLQHLVQCSPHLVYLDLSGTSVTRDGVQRFKAQKTECHIVADHLVDLQASDTNRQDDGAQEDEVPN